MANRGLWGFTTPPLRHIDPRLVVETPVLLYRTISRMLGLKRTFNGQNRPKTRGWNVARSLNTSFCLKSLQWFDDEQYIAAAGLHIEGFCTIQQHKSNISFRLYKQERYTGIDYYTIDNI
ncbi:hypothetical protein PROFUN_15208 [Planoprotostelium fungivorum]|uniref:Uncharacterized protein n=1 Tax=Planoprotostelium fungivorum TaxID=1890364 RepID=A0A2P6MWY2_9EUKA|nr:hypothetical protein PROFUN_15208 [Planoprotostelium fungivorum]